MIVFSRKFYHPFATYNKRYS